MDKKNEERVKNFIAVWLLVGQILTLCRLRRV